MSAATAPALLPVEEALERLLQQADATLITETESVGLADGEGRVLARPLRAGLDLPPWPNSAMDGYALRQADLGDSPLPVSQKIFAGVEPGALQPGTCARIFTGAPMPEGADSVEMQENTETLADGRVVFHQSIRQGQHVRPQGGEARRGETLMTAGTRLGPLELALAASVGAATLEVVRRPRVALLSTGNELVEPGQPLAPGQIYNSNRSLLKHWLQRMGCEVQDVGILADQRQHVRDCLESLGEVDLILSTGGVSVGEADVLGQVLREEGELTFWKLAIKPGKPLTCGSYRGVAVIGLPGNPASTLVTFGMLARPYLLRRMGVQEVAPLGFDVPAGFDWPKPGSRREYLRARMEHGRVVLHDNQSSAVLRSAAWAHGLAEVREGRQLKAGDTLRFYPFSELLG
nr:molybdopterin molybdotransferase MoeA [Pseudomonas sp.]